jgi:hypothetical protein
MSIEVRDMLEALAKGQMLVADFRTAIAFTTISPSKGGAWANTKPMSRPKMNYPSARSCIAP